MRTSLLVSCLAVSVFFDGGWQTDAAAQSDTPMTRMRPLGAPSAVDTYRGGSVRPTAAIETSGVTTGRVETAFRQQGQPVRSDTNPVRQTVWMQSEFTMPPGAAADPITGSGSMGGQAPPGGATMPPGTQLPDTPPYPNSAPPALPPNAATSSPRALPPPGSSTGTGSIPPNATGSPVYPPSSDLTPMSQPQLGDGGFATPNNCHLITGPSPYMAASAFGSACGCIAPTTYVTPVSTTVSGPALPPEIAAPAAMPPPPGTIYGPAVTQVPAAPPSAAPAPSLLKFGQENYPLQIGQGLWGQPVAYVPGQCVRNWLRYFSF
ncbi:hypothetical protein FYK55_12995 [Roseiconus nitratireducens]|uniref:Uncharacterized protein n=1 Tax=Roseiconus nitratireducens TaxID=2605748 RepID=A0A5M6D6Q2_9BACT|nr:hypothetical protein [Roseiconus nitratireducens]KAA5543191.1 hypothetical protein FYK55_12995 [Roseiconus nitratireducens]